MALSVYYPYRSEAARNFCLEYIDSLAARQWPIASEQRMVPTTYGTTFVRVSGPAKAPPLVLLHGAATTSLMWAPNIEALSAGYSTFAVDQIGEFGKSVCTTPIGNLNDLLVWLDELFDGLGLRYDISLAGLSYGGALAAQYALRYPERLRNLILLAPGATVLRIRPKFMLRLVFAAVTGGKGLPAMIRWMFADVARKDPQWIDSTIELLQTNMRNVQRHKVLIPPVLTDAEWRNLKTSTLFLVGEHETVYSAKKAVRRLKRVAPEVTSEIIPGAGHDLTFAQTATVNEKILEFLGRRESVARRVEAN